MQVSPTLKVLCSSKGHGFLLGGRWSSWVWLRGPQSGMRECQASGDGSLKTQLRVGVRA